MKKQYIKPTLTIVTLADEMSIIATSPVSTKPVGIQPWGDVFYWGNGDTGRGTEDW